MLAIIGGSGLAGLVGMQNVRRRIARTPWGDPSAALSLGELSGRPVLFLARHGYGHTIAPQDINYLANVQALRDMGATGVIAVSSVGGIDERMSPGAMMVPDQIIDYTSGRRSTYFGTNPPVMHVDFTQPYDEALRALLLHGAAQAGLPVIDGGCYGCTSGPRFETAAEVRRMQRDGCDVVGMTGMPEAILARELALPYASLCLSSNDAAGLRRSARAVDLHGVRAVLDRAMEQVTRILAQCAKAYVPPA